MSRRKPKDGDNTPRFDYEEIVRATIAAQAATAHIPRLIHEELQKGWKQLPNTDPNRSPKSWFFDPLALQYSLGYKDRRYSVTYDTLKRIAAQLSIVSAIINTRCAQVAAFSQPYRWTKSLGFVIRHKDPDHSTTPAEVAFIKELEQFIMNCGRAEKNPYSQYPRDDFEGWLRKIVRDSLVYDQTTTEVVRDQLGLPYEFYAVDASTIRFASDDRYVGVNSSYTQREGFVPSVPARFSGLYEGRSYGTLTADNERVRYVQVINGQIENIFSEKDLIFGVRNLRTDIYIQGYGWSELEQLITIVTAHLNAESYNMKWFTQNSTPKGILNMKGDNWTPEQLEMFKRHWAAQVSGVENCIHGNTVIFTKQHGAKSINDVLGEKKETEVNIWTGKSWEPALVYKTKEPKQLCKTTLANGIYIESSPDHKFLAIGTDGNPTWKRQFELQVGDYVCVNRKDTSAQTEIPAYNGKTLSPDIMEVLGWMTGDGYLHSLGKTNYLQCFYHHIKEQDIRIRHFNTLKEFGLPVALKEKHLTEEDIASICERYGFKTASNLRIWLQVFDAEFVRWLVSLGFNPSRKGKCIPSFIYTLPPSHRAAFLRGFFSADGNLAKKRFPAITIANENLRNDTKLLLLTLGIRTCTSEGKKKLRIDGTKRDYVNEKSYLTVKDKEEFFSLVGFIQAHKQPKTVKENEAGKSDRISIYTVQAYGRKIREKLNESNSFEKWERDRLNAIICGSDGCSRKRLLKWMQRADIVPPTWLLAYHFEPITNIENTTEVVPMYDVTVYDENHTFVGNGIVLHNSWRTPILQSEGIEWIDLHKGNEEMGFMKWMEYLLKITCGVFLIDPAELNFDLHGGVQQTPLFESSQEWKLKASRDRGLKPLLKFIAKLINKHIIDQIDDHFTLEFVGLDEMSEQEKHEMLVEQIASYMTLNEARRQLDLPDLPYGDIPLNPTYIQAMQQQMQMEQMQGQQTDPNASPDQMSQEQNQQALPPGEPMYAEHFGLQSSTPSGNK